MNDKKTSINVRIDEKMKKKLGEVATEEGTSITGLIRRFILRGLQPESRTQINKYRFLDDGCPLRDYLEEEEAPKGKNYGEGFYCMKKAPTLKLLGSGIDSAASKICTKCQIRDGAKDYEIQKKEGIRLQMPRCTKGGYPSEDLSNMYCPIIGRYRPVEEKKKKTDYIPCRLAGINNSNCKHLKRITIVKGLREEEESNL